MDEGGRGERQSGIALTRNLFLGVHVLVVSITELICPYMLAIFGVTNVSELVSFVIHASAIGVAKRMMRVPPKGDSLDASLRLEEQLTVVAATILSALLGADVERFLRVRPLDQF